MAYKDQISHTYLFKHCPATGMQHPDETSRSIISASRDILVKMLISLESHGIFLSNFAYNTLEHCPDTGMQNVSDLYRLKRLDL